MTKVIQARGFRDDIAVSISDLLGKPENAGLIVRREGLIIPSDVYESGSTFLVRVSDGLGKPRRICFVSLGSYGTFYSGQKVSLRKDEVHYPTAWCLCNHDDQDQWVGLQVFARVHQGRNKFIRPCFERSSSGAGYSYQMKSGEVVFISLREVSRAFSHVLDGQALCGPFKWEKNAFHACCWIAYRLAHEASFARRTGPAMESFLKTGVVSPEVDDLVKQVSKRFGTLSPGRIAHLWRWMLSLG